MTPCPMNPSELREAAQKLIELRSSHDKTSMRLALSLSKLYDWLAALPAEIEAERQKVYAECADLANLNAAYGCKKAIELAAAKGN